MIENLHGPLAAFALEQAKENSRVGLKLNPRLHSALKQHFKLTLRRIVAIKQNRGPLLALNVFGVPFHGYRALLSRGDDLSKAHFHPGNRQFGAFQVERCRALVAKTKRLDDFLSALDRAEVVALVKEDCFGSRFPALHRLPKRKRPQE